MSAFRQLCQCLRVAFRSGIVAGACAASLGVLCLLGIGGVQADESPDDESKVRFILSTGALTDINVNDAIAAFHVWLGELGANLNMPVAQDAVIFSSIEAIESELDKYPNHLVSLSLPAYLRFDADRFVRDIYLAKSSVDGAAGSRYLVLVREGHSIETLAELRDKKLIQYDHRNTTMAREWLDYQLAEAGQVSSAELLESYTKDSDLSKAVLSVFFGQIDACIVSDRSFNLMCELNPQIRHKLKVLARSPVVVSGGVFIQSDYEPHLEARIGEIKEWLETDISGKQIMTLFGLESVYRTDLSELQDSIDLYTKWTSVKGAVE